MWYSVHGSTGTWTLADDGQSGTIFLEDSSEYGTWQYDEGTQDSGTWSFTNVTGTFSGQWISTTEDPYTMISALNPIGVYYAIDGSSGFWASYDDTWDLWIKADFSVRGFSAYDDTSETTGTWYYSNETRGG